MWRVLAVFGTIVIVWLFWPVTALAPYDKIVKTNVFADEPLKIIVFGTSLTANYDWPSNLVAQLETCLPQGVEMEVFAQSGQGSAWAAAQVSRVARLEPDIVVMEFAINDADLFDGVSLDHAAQLHGLIIDEFQQGTTPPALILLTMNPAQGLRGWIRPNLARHYLQYRTLANENNIGLVDLFPRWLSLERDARGLQTDGLHPDADIARHMIVAHLVQHIGDTIGAKCIATDLN